MNNTVKVKIKKLHPAAKVPKKATPGAMCVDLHAVIDNDKCHEVVRLSRPVTFRTGLSFEIPVGYGMLIFSRSGHGFNRDVRLSNCVGAIDSDFRGEVCVKLASDSPDGTPLVVTHLDRIAQALILPILDIEFVLDEQLSETERGEGGFGSTGA